MKPLERKMKLMRCKMKFMYLFSVQRDLSFGTYFNHLFL